MNGRFALGVALLASVMLAVPFLPGLVRRFGISPGASLIQEGGNYAAFSVHRTSFWHEGYWVITRSLVDGSLCYFYSSDGTSWSSPAQIEACGDYYNGQGAAVWKEPYPSPYVHIVYSGNDGNLYYRRGTVRPEAIGWEERVVVKEVGEDLRYRHQVCVSDGNVWVLWGERETSFIKCLNTGDVFSLPDIRISVSGSDKQMCPLPGGKVAVYGITTTDYAHKVLTVSTSGVEQVEEIGVAGYTWNLNIVRSGDRLYVAFPWYSEGEMWYISVYGKLPGGWVEVYRSDGISGATTTFRPPVSLTPLPGGGLALYYMEDYVGYGLFGKGIEVRSPDGLNWGEERAVLQKDPDEWGFLLGDSSYYTDGGVVCTFSLSITPALRVRAWFWKTAAAPPSPPSPPPPHQEYMYLGGGPKVSAFGYYFTSDRGCVLLVRAVFENGDPLPAGTRVTVDGQCMKQTEEDVWYLTYPPGTPAPAQVFGVFEMPGYPNVQMVIPVSVGSLLGDLQVLTSDEGGNPVPALVEVRVGGVLVASQNSTGLAVFRGLPAGKAVVSAVSTGLLSPPPCEVNIAPNRMTTATLVFRRIYDPSVRGTVLVRNVGQYDLVVSFDGGDAHRLAPGESLSLDLPAGNHYAVYTGTDPLLYEPEVLTFFLAPGETRAFDLRVSPARDEAWLREWTENVRTGVGVGSLSVLVVDKASGTPVPGAAVYLDVGLHQITSSGGTCHFTGVPAGTRVVKACAPGYFPAFVRVEVVENATVSVQVPLRGFLYEAPPPFPVGRALAALMAVVLLSGVALLRYIY